ncbi:MAG TPA: hypothetical protein VGC05_02740, partial [Mycobacterium sp.]
VQTLVLQDTAAGLDEALHRTDSTCAAKVPRSERVRQRSYYPAHREAFVESAAMDREMYRL